MFRQPKSSNQSPVRKQPNLVVNPTANASKRHGLCKYRHRKCNFVSLDNYDYCLKHILEDKSAPYKPCPFLYTVSGKKCGKPALRQERKDTWFCGEHSRKTHLQRQRAMSRHAPPKTQETLFATLGHYVPPEQPRIKKEEGESDENEKGAVRAVDPFVDVDAGQVNSRISQVLDYMSESDSDVETAMLDSVWRAQDHESSDAESVDSQNEDPLKHAGTYTAEEVTIIIKDKMLRLQSLYIDQFRRLHHLLKEKRRKYLHSLKKEKETLCSIHDQEKQTAREQKLYQKLKALNRYHKHHGVEAILHKKALDLRAQVTEGHQLRTSHKGKCAFTEGGVKCGAKTLPVTKYCRKHILEDTQQVLFRSCGVRRDDHICQEPTLNVFENATCVYHTVLPAQPHDKLVKPISNENPTSEGDGTQTTQNDSENSFVNVTDSEEQLIKEILKPDLNSSGKPDSVDPLELSRTVSDILALAEAHSSSTDLGQTDDKSFLDQNIDAISSDTKPFTNDIMEASFSESTKPVTDPCPEPSTSLSYKPEKFSKNLVSDQKMETSSSETHDVKSTSVCEKMDVEDQPNQEVTLEEEDVKQETSDGLEMVNIMTDVGVVEEVLETEQIGVDSEEVVGSEQEVGGVEEEVEGSKQDVVVTEQTTGSEENVLGSEDQVEGTEQEEEKKQVVKTDQKVVESREAMIGHEYALVESAQQESPAPETSTSSKDTKEKLEEPMEEVVENENQPENG